MGPPTVRVLLPKAIRRVNQQGPRGFRSTATASPPNTSNNGPCDSADVNATLHAMSMPWLRALVVEPSVRARDTGIVLLSLLLLLVLAACSSGTGSGNADSDGTAQGNLLASRAPIQSSGVSRPGRITDGIVAVEGNDWRTDLTSVLDNPSAFVVWDLGQVLPIRAVSVQGDANDSYAIGVSDDGTTWKPLWTAEPVRASGMRMRSSSSLDAAGRYVRLTASGGDGRFSVAEVGVWSQVPSPFPSSLVAMEGTPLRDDASQRMLVLVAVTAVFLWINHRDASWKRKLLGVVPLGFAGYLAVKLAEMWPLDSQILTMLRATVAAIAVVAVLRTYFPGKTTQPNIRWTTATLALLALLSLGCYYNFGTPQFRDHAKDRPTLVHPWDMRVYFPLVKYFDELRFDGLYLASLAAYLDNNPNATEGSIGNVRLRDLNTNDMKVANDVMPDIRAIRDRFTPERWEMFRKDMKYFQDLMGPGGYLGSLRDHGGNATPVWILSAYPLWAWSSASELTLTLTALLDPLLLLAMLVVVGRTFGWRTAFITAIVFGTTDLSRFGSNLMGSTLRLDWMVAVGFGACALYKKKWATGGALLAYAGLIRGFPALATLFVAAPVAIWFIDWVRSKNLPDGQREKLLTAFRRDRMPFVRIAAGAVPCVVLLFALSSAVFGYQASWGNWFYKISIHQDKPNVNHVGLRNIMSYESEHTGDKVLRRELSEPWTDWQTYQLAALERRKPLFLASILLFTGLAIAACRKRQYHQAALMGMMLIPVYFYPANYYCHYVFLLPMLAANRKSTSPSTGTSTRLFGWVAIVLLAMSVALYYTLSERQTDVLYTHQSYVILAGFLLILAPMAYFAWRKELDPLRRRLTGYFAKS